MATRKVTIPNWTQFGVMVAGVTLFRFDDEEKTSYQAAFTLFLDDGEEVDEEKQRVITIITELISDDKIELATIAFQHASDLFTQVTSTVPIIDEDGKIFDSIDLNDLEQVKPISIH
jgi:hypothetical protein